MKARVNGREIQSMSGCSVCYNPLAGQAAARDSEMPKEEELIEYYGLDEKQGWGFGRWNLKWGYQRIPRKLDLELLLKPDKYHLPCQETFETIPEDGERKIMFSHPLTGEKYTLGILRVAQGSLEEKMFHRVSHKDYRYPLQYQSLKYYIAGEGCNQQFMVQDVEKGDSPVKGSLTEKSACSVAVIGGADGPTSIFLAKPTAGEVLSGLGEGEAGTETVREAFSRLLFEPVEKTTWQIYAIVERGEEKNLKFRLI